MVGVGHPALAPRPCLLRRHLRPSTPTCPLPPPHRYEKGKLLIFVSSQDRCDTLFRDLLRAGYPCLRWVGGRQQGGCAACLWHAWCVTRLATCSSVPGARADARPPLPTCPPAVPRPIPPLCSLHGGKDQSDRESTVADFKANVCNILVATSGDWWSGGLGARRPLRNAAPSLLPWPARPCGACTLAA